MALRKNNLDLKKQSGTEPDDPERCRSVLHSSHMLLCAPVRSQMERTEKRNKRTGLLSQTGSGSPFFLHETRCLINSGREAPVFRGQIREQLIGVRHFLLHEADTHTGIAGAEVSLKAFGEEFLLVFGAIF